MLHHSWDSPRNLHFDVPKLVLAREKCNSFNVDEIKVYCMGLQVTVKILSCCMMSASHVSGEIPLVFPMTENIYIIILSVPENQPFEKESVNGKSSLSGKIPLFA